MSDYASVVFDPDFPLDGATLVEASAGTGKTYNIQNTYLRLVVAQGLTVQEILVVTFTEAATHELRLRLRAILVRCCHYLEGRLAGDDQDRARIEAVVCLAPGGSRQDGVETKDIQLARVRLALMDFDNASVSTIHGFCQRTLDRYAFECGYDPDAELVADASVLLEEVCRDWWRRNCYGSAEAALRIVFKNPAELLSLLKAALKHPDVLIVPTEADVEMDPLLQAVHAAWPAAVAEGSGNNKEGRSLLAEMRTLLQSLEASSPDFRNIRRSLDVCLSAADNATITPIFPDWMQTLTDMAAVGGDDPSRRLVEMVRENGTQIGDWLHGRCLTLKAGKNGLTKKAQDFRDAVVALASAAGTTSGLPEAAVLRGSIRALTAATPKELFDPKLGALCPELMSSLGRVRGALNAQMAAVLRDRIQAVHAHIREKSVLTYDAMLTRVRDALRSDSGERLMEALRGEFKAALIDEFQDTDPVQYEIFRTVFGDPNAPLPLLYVGDPKQAIYGFRNGDIFTYYAAKSDVTRHHDLGTNFRSEVFLVDAVNALFGEEVNADSETDARAFRNENIRYASLAAHGVNPERVLTIDGRPDKTPLRLWRYSFPDKRVPGKESPVAWAMYADVAEEIVRLLTDPLQLFGGGTSRARGILPGDIAVLVMDHAEADMIHQALAQRNVNVERQSTGCVFDGREAGELALLLKALLAPRDAVAVRSALCTSLFACTDVDLRRFATLQETGSPEDDGLVPVELDAGAARTFDGWLELFCEAGERWKNGTFMESFRYVAAQFDLRAHLLGLRDRDGARVLTNVLHMAELVHQAAHSMQLTPSGVLRWFVRQIDPATRDENEGAELRPTSDDNAVKIMTVFKSKGLEFPIVFVPTLWRRKAQACRGDEAWLTYHGESPARGAAPMVMNLDTKDAEGAARAKEERLQENLRLVYVALTRAVNRVYVFTVHTTDGDVGALGDYALSLLADRVIGSGADGICKAAHICVESGPQNSDVITLWQGIHPSSAALKTLDQHTGLMPIVEKKRGHASFSSLIPHATQSLVPVLQDVDAATGADAAPPPDSAEINIFSIPAGATTGNCWHAMFERIDFQAGPASIAAIVDEELDRYRICSGPAEDVVQRKRKAVHDMVNRVLSAKLSDAFSLRDVPGGCRRSELSFFFTLKQQGDAQTTRVIYDVLNRHWQGTARDEVFLDRLRNSLNELPLGFMTGFMDLVFQHRGKFYIVDWKSNRLGGVPESFVREGLASEMATHAYYLQYLIYTVALDAFLRRKISGYDYNTHIGGVYYIFLRGVDPAAPGRGVFHDRPSAELIQQLSMVLAAGTEGTE